MPKIPDRVTDDPTYDPDYVWPSQRINRYTSGHYDEDSLEERGLAILEDVEEDDEC